MSKDEKRLSSKKTNHPLRILCVDDVELNLALWTYILEAHGCAVTSCASAIKTVDTFVRGEFDLAIIDYEMPVMSGSQLAARLKAVRPELKIILYTGAVNIKKRDLRFVDQMVRKGDGVSTLLAAIRDLVPHWRQSAKPANDSPRINKGSSL
jgi:CheY-like chemotaxis protein